MNNEFVTYEQSIALKELGFDEPCLGFYVDKKFSDNIILEPVTQKYNEGFNCHQNSSGGLISAPLYQQAFKFFREKYGIKFHIREDIWNNWCYLNILSGEEYVIMGEYKSYEEAESACLDKLIEIIKNKNE